MPNRIVFGAHLTNFGVGQVMGERHLAYYRARAAGGAGMIVTEALTVHPQDYPYEHVPFGHREAIVPSLARLAEALREAGGATPPLLLAQLNHTGGQCPGRMLRQSPWAPSPLPDVASKKMAREMTVEEIAQVVAGFATAAEHVAAAGLDGVELNAGQHALLRQFRSPLTNVRDDAYGGSLENRLRMPREVLRAVRARLGRKRLLGLKLCGDELAPWGGLTPEDAGEIARRVAEEGEVDYISVQIGGPYSVHLTDAAMPTPQGYGTQQAQVVRTAVEGRLPVFAEGRIETDSAAREALAQGRADAVVMTRALVSDPDLPRKLQETDGEPVRPHVGMPRYFTVRGDWNRPLGDLSNPRAGREALLPPVERLHGPGAALVIGGGPAGMEAAFTLARQGRAVRLLEASPRLGGMARRLAQRVPALEEFALLVDYYGVMLERQGVSVATGSRVERYEPWMDEYEKIVLATGARSQPAPPTPTGRVPCLSARTVLHGEEEEDPLPAAGRALVVDGEHGFRMAAAVERLLALGWQVDVISEDFYVGRGLVESAELAWFNRVARQGARLHPRLRLLAVKGRKALCEERYSGRTQQIGPLALVVYALAELPRDNLLAELRARHPAVLRVGDAAAPRMMGEAILNAHRTVLLE